MRVGIVTTWFERGAAYVSKIFENTLSEQHEVFIYARGGELYAKGDPIWDKENVHWGKQIISPFSSTVIDKKDFLKWIKKFDIEAILFNEQHWWEPVIWCKESGIKTIAYVDYYTEETVPYFNLYDALICNTKRHYSVFEQHHNAIYLPWGTDLNLYKPSNEGLINPEFVTFFHSCGWDINRKGTDHLIKAFSKTKHAKKLIIHTQNHINEESLNPLINQLLSEGRLELIIKTVEAPGLYFLGDVYVYPTRLEGIGLTVPEALASGLGIVVPDNAPMNEFGDGNSRKLIAIDKLIARRDGYYWPKCEIVVEHLASIMDELALSSERVLKMKIEARKYALANLNATKNFSPLNQILEDLSFMKPDYNLVNNIRRRDRNGFKIFHKTYLRGYPIFNTIRNIIKKYDL